MPNTSPDKTASLPGTDPGRGDSIPGVQTEGTKKGSPATGRQKRRDPHSYSYPVNPFSVRQQIAWEAENVRWRNQRHQVLASRWDAVASWTRVIVALTAGISAISIVADSVAMATIFAVITAAVSALNAGFSPPELAKKHQDAARAYGHLERPLAELLYKLDEYNETEYVPQTGYSEATKTYYDAGFYRAISTQAEPEDLRAIWEVFSKDRERIETIDENAPSLMGLVWGWGRHETSDRPIEGSVVSA